MKKIAIRLASIIAMLTPLSLLAHPGHGAHDHEGGYTIIHYFTQPSHAIVSVAVLAITAILIRNLRRKNQKA
jgi:hydrogenase/urease accessory protein HupE